MPNLNAIKRSDPVQYTAVMGSESVTIVFDNSRMTGRWERDVNRARQSGDVDKVASLIFSIFVAWDVTDDSGNPVPISEEILLDLPSRALFNLFEGMQQAAMPSSEEGNVSSDTSSTPGIVSLPTPVSPQNGPATSSSPPVSASPSPT